MENKMIENEIEKLEELSKKGERYTNNYGSFGWRNPIRKDTGRIIQSLVISANPKAILEVQQNPEQRSINISSI